MATAEMLAKAMLYRRALGRVLGQKPDYEVQDDYVRLYWAPDQVKKATDRYGKLVEAEPGEVRVDLAPVVMPYYTKKYLIFALGALAGAFFLGKMSE